MQLNYLLIDDNPLTNRVHKALFEQTGTAKYIHCSGTGQDALDYLTESGEFEDNLKTYLLPHLIFLDINMQEMNAWEFMKKYNELQIGLKAQIVIIMLSTSINPKDEALAMKIKEINGFEHKPLTNETLTTILSKYFGYKPQLDNSCVPAGINV